MISLPDFSGTRCVYFQACGLLQRSETGKVEPPASDKLEPVISSRLMNAGRMYLRFFEGPHSRHLHLDIALASIFPRGRKPKVTTQTPKILRRIADHEGQRLTLLILCQYIIEIKDANLESGFLLTGERSVVPTKTDAKAEIVSARLTLRNVNHIDTIQWELLGSQALVDIYGHCDTEVSRDYLVNAFDLAQTAFTTYFVGEAVA
jgi:hypothetical protein